MEFIYESNNLQLIIKNKTITISIGVTEVIENDNENSIYKRVDDNLYISKNSGKNRITAN